MNPGVIRKGIEGAALAVALSGCGLRERVGLPEIGGAAGRPFAFEDRVWASGEGPETVFRVFLSSGALLTAPCGGAPHVAPWRRVDATTLVWEENGAVLRAEIAGLGPREFALLRDPGPDEWSESHRRVQAPAACPGD
jgi:hypothetical protein